MFQRIADSADTGIDRYDCHSFIGSTDQPWCVNPSSRGSQAISAEWGDLRDSINCFFLLSDEFGSALYDSALFRKWYRSEIYPFRFRSVDRLAHLHLSQKKNRLDLGVVRLVIFSISADHRQVVNHGLCGSRADLFFNGLPDEFAQMDRRSASITVLNFIRRLLRFGARNKV